MQAAGNAVKRASEALVRAAQQERESQDDDESLTVNKRMVGGIAQVSSHQPNPSSATHCSKRTCVYAYTQRVISEVVAHTCMLTL